MSFSPTDDEAERRATAFKSVDPYPSVPCSTLSSEHIIDYISATGLIYPFVQERLKTASYEIRPGGTFFYWKTVYTDGKHENRIKYAFDISKLQYVEIPPNSISFIGIDCKIRLPNYIAMRFNLHIKHVHRGLLLGTGPIVDPGFQGRLLIPLHNLTNSPHRIHVNDGLIWTEFTKTTFSGVSDDTKLRYTPISPPQTGKFVAFPPTKINLSDDDYINKATNGEGVENAIPSIVVAVQDDIRRIEQRVGSSINYGIGAIVVTIGVALLGLFPTLFMLYQVTQSYLAENGDFTRRIAAVELAMKDRDALLAIDKKSQSDLLTEVNLQAGVLTTIQGATARLDAEHTNVNNDLAQLKTSIEQLKLKILKIDGHPDDRQN